MECPIDADQQFGPRVDPSCRSFDFTLLFEQTIYIVLPCGLMVAAATLRIAALLWLWPARRRRGRDAPPWIRSRRHTVLTVITLAGYAALECAALVQVATAEALRATTIAAVPAAAMSCGTAVMVGALWYVEQRESARPSMLLGAWLALQMLLRAVVVRTLWLMTEDKGGHGHGHGHPHGALAATSLSSLLMQAVLLVLEERRPGPQSGFLARSLLSSLLGVLRAGWFRTLDAHHVLSATSAQLPPPHHHNNHNHNHNQQDHHDGLLRAFLRQPSGIIRFTLTRTPRRFLLAVPPRLALTAFSFAQPFLTTALVEYFSRPRKPRDQGCGLVGACLLVYGSLAVANGWSRALVYRWVADSRALYIDLIFQKLSRLAPCDDGVEALALTLMSSDVQRVVVASSFIHELWAAPLEAGLATWLLWRELGPSSATALALALLCAMASLLLGKRVAVAQRTWLQATEQRVRATRKLLVSLKALKMMAMDAAAAASITNLRQLEFAASKPFRSLVIGSVFVSYSTLSLAPVVAFGTYVGIHGAAFDKSKFFSSLILVALLANPLVRLFQIVPHFGAALACIDRLQAFLRRPESGAASLENGICSSSHNGETELEKENLFREHSPCRSMKDPDLILAFQDVELRRDDRVLLSNINFRVSKGHHVVICGPVGSGKTTLMRLLLGELSPSKGCVKLDRSLPIGYCAQSPWLENLSVYDNIFQHVSPDPSWRDKVIDACAVRSILDVHHAGGVIGSRGAKISGGEKQRIALARAVALRPAVLLLDDPLSAVDRAVSAYVMGRLLGKSGLLRQLETTVVQVTNDDYIKQYAQEVFEMDMHGSIQLMPAVFPRGYYAEDGEHEKLDQVDVHEVSVEGSVHSTSQATTPAHAANRVSDIQAYRTYFGSIGWPVFVVFFVCGALFAFTLKFPEIWAKWWADGSKIQHHTRGVGFWLGSYAVFSCLPLIMLASWTSLLMLKMLPKSGIEFHALLLRTVLGAQLSYMTKTDAGDHLNRFNQDMMLIDSSLPLNLLNTVSGLCLCVGQILLIVVPATYLLAAVPVLVAFVSLLQTFYLRTSKQVRHLDLQSKAALQTRLSELHEGLDTIRAHGLQGAKHLAFLDKLDQAQRPFYLLHMLQTWLQLVLNMMVAGLCTAVVGLSVGLRQSTSASGIGLAMLNLTTLGQSMENLIVSWTQMETSLAAIARIKGFELDTPQEPQDTTTNMEDIAPDWPMTGSLDVHALWATYSAHCDHKQDWALQNVSICVAAGEKVAICGRSGSGKSTLLLSILRLIEPSSGTIAIDGVDITRVPQTLLRSRVVTVPQEPFLHAAGTFRAVVDPNDNMSDAAVLEVLQECGLSRKVDAAGGLTCSLSALTLSAGEMQLLVLARTMIQAERTQAGIILLDESTSSIDHAAGRAMLQLIRKKLAHKTVLAIMHNLEAAIEFDRIVVLDRGKLTHDASPAEVMRECELFSSFK
ncbi:unnamed protein product [Zymoseptoria tritici ST99CH_1E4]|uniref:ABC transporter n=1 Tax=Zymoseptoria tritici ST99CH_1E4 TaxID=1276532 RepID=A0A2H1GBQ1_ZYMTR|nr:unnamed protein product [Zymoseptoria tritici ST99CH_1E4]